MGTITIIDVIDEPTFRRIPPCADPGFDHRSCDYWEDAERGSKAARHSWLRTSTAGAAGPQPKPVSANPFLADLEARAPAVNPFAAARPSNPFLTPGELVADPAHAANDDEGAVPGAHGPGIDDDQPAPANPFAPPPPDRPAVGSDAPPKLKLLGRGLGIAGSYSKVLLVDDVAAVYAQFGPLTAYPRAQRTRDLYPSLPDAPLPAVITCIASTAEARSGRLARTLVEAVCDDLGDRGFTAVETYPTIGAAPDATSAATPGFWASVGFELAIDDDRFPVMRRDLT